MTSPPRHGAELGPRIVIPAVLVLSGCGLAATLVSPSERVLPVAPAVEVVAVEAPPTDGEAIATIEVDIDAEQPTPGAARVVEDTTTTSSPTTFEIAGFADAAEAAADAETEESTGLMPAFGVETRRDLVYGTALTAEGEIDLMLDLYVPVEPSGEALLEDQPAAILLHGGGFTLGERTEEGLPQLATALARHGIVTASISYRLAGDGPVVSTPALEDYLASLDPETVDEWLARPIVVGAAIEDTLAAASWLFERGVDPDRLVLGGSSAGAISALYTAHLVDDAGFDGPDVAAVIDLWGGYALTPNLADALDSGDAPVWIVHGTDDPIVSIDYATAIADRGADVGVDVIFNAQAGASHGFGAIDLFADRAASGEVLIDDLIVFLDEHI